MNKSQAHMLIGSSYKNKSINASLKLTYDIDDVRQFKSLYGRFKSFLCDKHSLNVSVDVSVTSSMVKLDISSYKNKYVLLAADLLCDHLIEWFGSLRSGDIKTVEKLLKSKNINHQIDINRATKDGVTPLMIACGHGGFKSNKLSKTKANAQLAYILVKHGANKDFVDEKGYTAYSLVDGSETGLENLVKPSDPALWTKKAVPFSKTATKASTTVDSKIHPSLLQQNSPRNQGSKNKKGSRRFSSPAKHVDGTSNGTSLNNKRRSSKLSLKAKSKSRLSVSNAKSPSSASSSSKSKSESKAKGKSKSKSKVSSRISVPLSIDEEKETETETEIGINNENTIENDSENINKSNNSNSNKIKSQTKSKEGVVETESPDRSNADGCEIENINNKSESSDGQHSHNRRQSQLSEDSRLLLAVKELNELRYNGFDKSRNSSISSLSCGNLNNLNSHKSGNTYASRRTNNNFVHRGPTTTGKAKRSRPSYEIRRNPKTNTLTKHRIKNDRRERTSYRNNKHDRHATPLNINIDDIIAKYSMPGPDDIDITNNNNNNNTNNKNNKIISKSSSSNNIYNETPIPKFRLKSKSNLNVRNRNRKNRQQSSSSNNNNSNNNNNNNNSSNNSSISNEDDIITDDETFDETETDFEEDISEESLSRSQNSNNNNNTLNIPNKNTCKNLSQIIGSSSNKNRSSTNLRDRYPRKSKIKSDISNLKKSTTAKSLNPDRNRESRKSVSVERDNPENDSKEEKISIRISSNIKNSNNSKSHLSATTARTATLPSRGTLTDLFTMSPSQLGLPQLTSEETIQRIRTPSLSYSLSEATQHVSGSALNSSMSESEHSKEIHDNSDDF